MSDKYSAEWVKEQVGNRTWLYLRDCSLCGSPVGFRILPDGSVGYDSNCDCVSYTTFLRPASFEEIAETLRIQSSDEIRDEIMKRMLSNGD